jgi:hypothetical protein
MTVDYHDLQPILQVQLAERTLHSHLIHASYGWSLIEILAAG